MALELDRPEFESQSGQLPFCDLRLKILFPLMCIGLLVPPTHPAPEVHPPLFSTLLGAPVGWILWLCQWALFFLVSCRIWPTRDQRGRWEEKEDGIFLAQLFSAIGRIAVMVVLKSLGHSSGQIALFYGYSSLGFCNLSFLYPCCVELGKTFCQV